MNAAGSKIILLGHNKGKVPVVGGGNFGSVGGINQPHALAVMNVVFNKSNVFVVP